MPETLLKQDQGADCDIPNACARVVPAWLIVLDNAPTVVMFLLGAALIWRIDALLSFLFLAYCGLSILLFWKRICPWCHHFGTTGCPCGYSKIASRLFKRKTGREFRKVFRRNIVVVFPCWFVPLGAGSYLLWKSYSGSLLALFVAFCLIGFVIIPAISRFVGCKSCEIKDDCPWMC